MLGAELRELRLARGARPQDVRRERVRVHDVDATLGEEAREPRDVRPPEGTDQVRERVLARGSAVVDAQACRREVRPRARGSA